jgi:TPP-dependent pyruvate/acetoin dehydrogenase alpha subunit
VPGELDEWRLRDPLTVTRTGLAERYGVSDETLDEVDASVEQELNEVVEAAKAAPFPEPDGTAREFKDA